MSHRFHRRGIVLAAAVLVLAACGDEDDGGSAASTTSAPATTAAASTTTGTDTTAASTPDTAPSTAPATTQARRQDAPRVGEVIDIVPSGGRANEELVAPGTVLRRGSILAADPAGIVDFRLDQKVRRCQARPAAQVRLTGEGNVLLEFLQGTVWCGTSDDGGVVAFTVGDEVLRVNDPVFSVTVDEFGGLEVRVIQGFVQVEGGPTLGEGQRGNRTEPGAAWSVGPFGLSELPSSDENDEGPSVQRLLDEVLGGLGPLRYPRPSIDRSPALTRAIDLGALPVRVVAVEGDPALSFTSQLLGDVASQRWAVPVEVAGASEEEALAGLESAEVAIVVATGDVASGGVPLFEDGQGQVWRAVVAGDEPELRGALEGFVRTALQATCEADESGQAARSAPEASCFEQLYLPTFGVDPVPLSPFAGLLGLG